MIGDKVKNKTIKITSLLNVLLQENNPRHSGDSKSTSSHDPVVDYFPVIFSLSAPFVRGNCTVSTVTAN